MSLIILTVPSPAYCAAAAATRKAPNFIFLFLTSNGDFIGCWRDFIQVRSPEIKSVLCFRGCVRHGDHVRFKKIG